MNEESDRYYRELMTRSELLRPILGEIIDKMEDGLKRQLLATPQQQMEKIYLKLRKLGIPDGKIASSPMLLGRDPAIMQRNYNFLVSKGFGQQFIVENAEIICLNPNLVKNPDFLKKLKAMEKRDMPAPEGEIRKTAQLIWKRSTERPLAKPVKLRLVR